MTKEQLKMWMKIIGFVILLAFGGLIIAGLVDGTGFVYDYFYIPFLFVIPLLLIVPIVILYVIYMFVEKGEVLRIIANILACILAVYVVGGVSLLRHSEFMNRYRYEELESSSYKIVSNIFENSTIEKDDFFSNPLHCSIGDMLVYENDFDNYIVNCDDGEVRCSVSIYCVDNYILGCNKFVKNFEENRLADISEWNWNDELVFEDKGSGETDGINYKWAYGEFWDSYTEKYFTEFVIMVTYENGIYYVVADCYGDERIYVNMDTESAKIVDMIKSMHIFIDYK